MGDGVYYAKNFYEPILLMELVNHCYETSSKNRRKERSTPWKLVTLRGQPPIHYINEQFFDDTNDQNLLPYIGVHGVTIILADLTIIM